MLHYLLYNKQNGQKFYGQKETLTKGEGRMSSIYVHILRFTSTKVMQVGCR